MKKLQGVALAVACIGLWTLGALAQPEYATWSVKQATSIGTDA